MVAGSWGVYWSLFLRIFLRVRCRAYWYVGFSKPVTTTYKLLQELVHDISRRIIGMQPTTISTPDINGVMKNRIIWEIPTSRPPPPDDEYIPRWDCGATHPANIAFLAKVLFDVKAVTICFLSKMIIILFSN